MVEWNERSGELSSDQTVDFEFITKTSLTQTAWSRWAMSLWKLWKCLIRPDTWGRALVSTVEKCMVCQVQLQVLPVRAIHSSRGFCITLRLPKFSHRFRLDAFKAVSEIFQKFCSRLSPPPKWDLAHVELWKLDLPCSPEDPIVLSSPHMYMEALTKFRDITFNLTQRPCQLSMSVFSFLLCQNSTVAPSSPSSQEGAEAPTSSTATPAVTGQVTEDIANGYRWETTHIWTVMFWVWGLLYF